MKIERLLGITIYLLNHKRVTAQTLAMRFEVSTRTIIRDVNTLSLAGIPIVTVYGAEGGYEILDSFKLERQIAGKNDYSYILTALQGLQTAFDNKELNDTLEKMHAIAPDCNTEMVLDFGTLNENRSTNEKLILLQQAVNRRQKVVFMYANAENEHKEHEVEPVAVMYKWYSWYLLCYYPKYEDYRIFKLVRMKAISITEQKNSKIHSVSEAKIKWEESQQKHKNIKVKLLCKSIIKSKCEEYLNGTIVEEFGNGDFIYEFQVPENEHFWYGTVLAFASNVKVIEPTSLIERIRLSCKKMLEQYEEV